MILLVYIGSTRGRLAGNSCFAAVAVAKSRRMHKSILQGILFYFVSPQLPAHIKLAFYDRLRGLGSVLGLLATGLGLGSFFDGALGAADGGDTLNGVLAKVRTVAGLGGLVGNSLVDPRFEATSARFCSMSPAYITMCQHSLAGRLGARDVGLGESLGGLGRVLDGLAQNGNTALLAGNDTDGLESRSLVCRACFRVVYVDRNTLSLTKPACCKSELVKVPSQVWDM